MKQKLMLVLLVLAMALTLLPGVALAADAEETTAPKVAGYGFVWEAKASGANLGDSGFKAGPDWMGETLFVAFEEDGLSTGTNLWFEVTVASGNVWGCAATASGKNMFAFSLLNRKLQWEQPGKDSEGNAIDVGADKEHAESYLADMEDVTSVTLKVYKTASAFTSSSHDTTGLTPFFNESVAITKNQDTIIKVPTVTPTPEVATLTFGKASASEECFEGKTVADMGTFNFEKSADGKTITVTGSAQYMTQDGFNSFATEEESGHYLPLAITASKDTDIKVFNASASGKDGKTHTLAAATAYPILIWLDGYGLAKYESLDLGKTFKVTVGDPAVTYTVDFSGVTLLPKPSTDPAGNTTEAAPSETPGKVDVTTTNGNGDTLAAVQVPETLGTGEDAVELSKTEVKAVPVAEASKGSVTVKPDTNQTLNTELKGENSTIVEITIKEIDADGTVKDEKLFTADNAIPSGIKVTIGGLESNTTYHVFCIKDDGTVIYYGSKTLGADEEELDFTTNHLCHFAAVKETPVLKEAVKDMTMDSSSNLTPSTIAVTGVTLNKSETSIEVGAIETLTATVAPANATNKALTWSSSDATIATVSSEGVVTGVKAGAATITVTTADGSFTATCAVTVTAASSSGGKTPSKSSSSGGGGAAASNVSVSSTSHGSVSVSPRNPSKNAKVTLTVRPNSGYVLDTITVKDSKGAEVELTKVSDTEYTFTMPTTRVTVDAKFVSDGSAPADTAPQGFSDVPADYWAKDEIAWAAANNVMGGFADGSFRPGNQVSRQQTWMVIARIAGASPTDMAAAKAWAVSSGVSDGTRPGESLTRQQLVTILYRYAQMKGFATTGAGDINTYPDAASVASYAQEAMAWAVGNGVIGGTAEGLLNPAGTATRAQFAVIMYRFSQQTAG